MCQRIPLLRNFSRKKVCIINDYSYLCIVSSHQASQRCSNAWGFFVYIRLLSKYANGKIDLYYKKFPTKRRYFSLWQSKQLKHPNMRAISPSLGSCFISSLFMQKQFRYFWLSFNPFSNSSIVGIDDLKSFGKSLES